MSLALHLTPMVRQWACRKRGFCCKHHHIGVQERERSLIQLALRSAGDPLASHFDGNATTGPSGQPTLPMQNDACIFLGSDKLCGLRQRFGDEAYPSVCKRFPYLSIETPDRQLIGLTFSCPTALELLAEESSFETLVEPDGVPPVSGGASLALRDRHYIDFRGDSVELNSFWQSHWDFFERLRSHTEPMPARRVSAIAEILTDLEAPPPAVVRRDLWRQGAFEPSVGRELHRLTGEIPPGLPWLWIDIPAHPFELAPHTDLDENALLMRYLLHRTLMPAPYLQRADQSFLLATLLAMVARYRIERTRGHEPLVAIRHLDRYFVHTGNPGTIFGSNANHPSWQAMSALALAVAIG